MYAGSSVTKWAAYQSPPAFVLGFHGTDSLTVQEVINQKSRHLKASKKKFDWLGHGAYFWENDPERAMEWARAKHIPNPDILGGVIDLGLCLDLTTRIGCKEVAAAFRRLKKSFALSNKALAKNTVGKDKLRRELDCQVITFLHKDREEAGLPPYDSIRAAFPESEALYPGAGFSAKGHIQICVRSAKKCVKGYFKPIQSI